MGGNEYQRIFVQSLIERTNMQTNTQTQQTTKQKRVTGTSLRNRFGHGFCSKHPAEVFLSIGVRRVGATCLIAIAICVVGLSTSVSAQSVCLPLPRLMTTMPMGGQIGTTFDVTITGQNCENVDELTFSDAAITAIPKLKDGVPISNQFVVTIAKNCPPGLYESRIMTRLGISSPRIFNVSTLSESNQAKPNTTLEQAMPLDLNSICNAVMTKQSVDYYAFEAKKGQRVMVDCAAKGIDSKMNAVLIVADSDGNDLMVERRGGAIDFTAPADSKYVIKVHDLTFNGGPYHFYRLAVQAVTTTDAVRRLAKTRTVSSFSWPPIGLTDDKIIAEVEPNSKHNKAQKISFPCDISGSFFPAADVDVFEFEAKKGDVWWVEVASERFGLQTDPSIVVQHVTGTGDAEQRTDLVELTDIASPIKVSSNAYSYDGPPYDAGSPDIIGKVEIKADGTHRLQLSDLFGGTRSDPRNIYRLIVRKAAPDFAIVGWGLHMNLRNGDRNALSKPISLRAGTTMAVEVIAVRRDGFDGEIELAMDNLPEGVTAAAVNIPAGKSRGIVFVSADENATRGLSQAKFSGKATIEGEEVIRTGHMASMAWPVPNAWSEVPSPRLMADLCVSVTNAEKAPITLTANESTPWEVTEGQKLTIPLKQIRRSEFSGANISLKTFGIGFEKNAAFKAPLTKDTSDAVLDLAKLKTPPGNYTIAFYGTAVAKYQYHPEALTAAELRLKNAQDIRRETTNVVTKTKSGTDEEKTAADAAHRKADVEVKAATRALTAAKKKAAAKDTVDIVVSTPMTIVVKPKEQPQKQASATSVTKPAVGKPAIVKSATAESATVKPATGKPAAQVTKKVKK